MICQFDKCNEPVTDTTKVLTVEYLCCGECGFVTKTVQVCDPHFNMVKYSVEQAVKYLSVSKRLVHPQDAPESLSDGS